jgi:hypothetical protein
MSESPPLPTLRSSAASFVNNDNLADLLDELTTPVSTENSKWEIGKGTNVDQHVKRVVRIGSRTSRGYSSPSGSPTVSKRKSGLSNSVRNFSSAILSRVSRSKESAKDVRDGWDEACKQANLRVSCYQSDRFVELFSRLEEAVGASDEVLNDRATALGREMCFFVNGNYLELMAKNAQLSSTAERCLDPTEIQWTFKELKQVSLEVIKEKIKGATIGDGTVQIAAFGETFFATRENANAFFESVAQQQPLATVEIKLSDQEKFEFVFDGKTAPLTKKPRIRFDFQSAIRRRWKRITHHPEMEEGGDGVLKELKGISDKMMDRLNTFCSAQLPKHSPFNECLATLSEHSEWKPIYTLMVASYDLCSQIEGLKEFSAEALKFELPRYTFSAISRRISPDVSLTEIPSVAEFLAKGQTCLDKSLKRYKGSVNISCHRSNPGGGLSIERRHLTHVKFVDLLRQIRPSLNLQNLKKGDIGEIKLGVNKRGELSYLETEMSKVVAQTLFGHTLKIAGQKVPALLAEGLHIRSREWPRKVNLLRDKELETKGHPKAIAVDWKESSPLFLSTILVTKIITWATGSKRVKASPDNVGLAWNAEVQTLCIRPKTMEAFDHLFPRNQVFIEEVLLDESYLEIGQNRISTLIARKSPESTF